MTNVRVLKTTPDKIFTDYQKLLTPYKNFLDHKKPVIIKLNLSWTKFYPACSSPPWQVEGVIKALLGFGFPPKNIIPVENQTVVTNIKQGARNHFWGKICQKYKIKIHYLSEAKSSSAYLSEAKSSSAYLSEAKSSSAYLTEEQYVEYKPRAKMLILNKIFPRGIFLPKIIFHKPLISLCTMKTHVFTTTTGAIKNYFGMLNIDRHFAHRYIHETLVDLLQIQKELHPKILGIMDGTIVGSGPGPRAMEWHQKDYLLASDDIVALDSIAAKMMGFNPLKINCLRLSHEKNLGTADPQKIKILGGKIEKLNFGFKPAETLASRGQKLIYHHSPAWLEKVLLQTSIAPWSYLASKVYFDLFWYHLIGKERLKKFLQSDWGKVFKQYSLLN